MKQEVTESFRHEMEQLLEYAERYDQELFDAFQWIDKKAQEEKITWSEKLYEILHRHDTKMKAQDWMKTITRKTVSEKSDS